MTVIVPGEMVEKMSVDESASDTCMDQRSKPVTPPQIRRRKKKKRATKPQTGTTFLDLYKLTGDSRRGK